MKKLLCMMLIAFPIFSGDVDNIIEEIGTHEPKIRSKESGSSKKQQQIYTLFDITPQTKIDQWYNTLKKAEKLIKKYDPTLLEEFNKIRNDSTQVINVMKIIYNGYMKATSERLRDDMGTGADMTKIFIRDENRSRQAKVAKAEKLLSPIKNLENWATTFHKKEFPNAILEKKRGFFEIKKKNQDKARLVLDYIKDMVAQHVISILQTFERVKITSSNNSSSPVRIV